MNTFINNLIATLTHRNKGVTSWSCVGFCVVKRGENGDATRERKNGGATLGRRVNVGERSFLGFFGAFASSALLLSLLTLSTATDTFAAPNYQMNYQGKLTNASNIAVADGTYNMRFWLLASSTVATTSALWTESLTGVNRVQVTNGLFSVMLGSTSPLTGVDFNQTLFLGVEIGSTTGSAVWDGEMSPRKVLGTVPAAFEANKLDGLDSTQFVRTDATSSIATSSASTLLTLTQSGAGDILNVFDGTTEVFTLTDGGRMGLGTTSPSRLFTMQGGDFWLGGNMTATGTAVFNALTVSASSTLGFASTTALTVANNAYLNTFTATAGTTTNATSTNLAVTTFKIGNDVITDITGTNLSVTNGILSAASTADGVSNWSYNGTRLTPTSTTAGISVNASSTIGGGTGATGLTINGTATSTNLKVTALTASRAVFTGSDNLFTTTAPSSYLSSSISDETGTGSLVFSTSPVFTGTPTFANLYMSPTGTSTLGYASTTALTVANNAYLNTFTATAGTTTNATSTNLAVTTFKIGNDVITDITGTNLSVTNGILSAASTADGVSNWSYNGTRLTPTSTTAGISVNASSTIGGGTGATGLTINGTATSTNLKVTALTASRAVFTGSDNLFTTTAPSSYLSSSISDETGTGSLVFSTSPIFTGTAQFAGLTVSASSTLGFASTTALTVANNAYLNTFTATAGTTTNATSSNLAVTTFKIGNDVITDITGTNLSVTNGILSAASTADGVSNWSYNGTRLTPTSTTAGISVNASSTIGGGTGATGLTINGTATSTNLKVTALTASRAVFTGSDNLFTTTAPSSYLSSSISDETGTGSLVFSASPIFTGTAQFAGITVSASSTLGFASSTALTVANNAYLNTFTANNGTTTNATSTNLRVSGLFTLGSDAITDITGNGLQNSSNVLTCITATGAAFGCLTSTDWTTFMGKVASSSIDSSSELATLVTDETGTGSLVFSASPVFTGTPTFANLYMSPTGTSTLGYASTTALTVANNAYLNTFTATAGTTTNATSSNLAVTTFKIGNDVITDITGTNLSVTNGILSAASTADGVSNWSYNGTRLTPTSTTAGISVNASSTIGGGTGATGLTINGTATSTNLKVTALTASRAVFTGSDNLFTTTAPSSYLSSSISDETGTGSLVFSTSPIFTGTAQFAGLTVSASSTLGFASTTALTVANNAYLNTFTATAGTTTNATSSNLAVTTFKIGNDVITDITGTNLSVTNGILSAASTADGVSNWSYNGTRLTPTSTTAGISVNASSTIGGGTGATGLTINGTATSTNLKVTALTASRAVFTGSDNLFTTTAPSSYLSSSISDETGTGSLVFSTSPIFTGTAQFAGLTVSASSTLGFASTTALTVANNAYLNTFTANNGTTTNATSTNLRVSGLFTLGSDAITDITGNGLQNSSNVLTCITATGAAFGCLTSTDWTTFMGKVASSSIDSSSELATLVTDETGTGSLVFSASPVFTGTPTFANLYMSPTGTSTLGYASTTALTVANNAYLNTFTATAGTTTNATSSNLAVTTFKIGNDVITDITGTNLSVTNGILSAASTADGVSNWNLTSAGDALKPTTTKGIIITASSTIGNGTATGGLTISGGATTTGNAYFAGLLGIATTTPSATLSLTGSGTTNLFSFASSTNSNLLTLNARGALTFGTTTNASIFMNGGGTTTQTHLSVRNIAIGSEAFSYTTVGASGAFDNIALGYQALYGSSSVLMTGDYNFAAGSSALKNNTTGGYNNALGYQSLFFNTTGGNNNALGVNSLYNNISGSNNNAFGQTSLSSNITGSSNNAFGSNLFGLILQDHTITLLILRIYLG
jgi:fibronectin-binding autotransporter adhesin